MIYDQGYSSVDVLQELTKVEFNETKVKDYIAISMLSTTDFSTDLKPALGMSKKKGKPQSFKDWKFILKSVVANYNMKYFKECYNTYNDKKQASKTVQNLIKHLSMDTSTNKRVLDILVKHSEQALDRILDFIFEECLNNTIQYNSKDALDKVVQAYLDKVWECDR